MVLTACGDNEQGKQVATLAETTSTPTQNPATGAQPKTTTEAQRAEKEGGKKGTSTRPRSKQPAKKRSAEKTLRRLPGRSRAGLARGIVPGVLKLLGFKKARVRVSPSGDAITVIIARAEACTAGPSDEARIAKRIKEPPLSFVRTVRVTVEGSGRRLTDYVAAHCKPRTIPRGRGKVVYEQSGSGIVRTEPFKIRAKRWTIEFENLGSFFQVFVYKGRKLQMTVISETRRGAGKKTFKGPGRFKLNISGSGDWTVRVRDGA